MSKNRPKNYNKSGQSGQSGQAPKTTLPPQAALSEADRFNADLPARLKKLEITLNEEERLSAKNLMVQLENKMTALREGEGELERLKHTAKGLEAKLKAEQEKAEKITADLERRDGELKTKEDAAAEEFKKYRRALEDLLNIKISLDAKDADYALAAQKILQSAVDLREDNRAAYRKQIEPLIEEIRRETISATELEHKKAQLERDQIDLEEDRKNLEKERADFEEHLVVKYGPLWQTDLDRKIKELDRSKEISRSFENQANERERELNEIASAFDGVSPIEMADLQNKLKEEVNDLRDELENRPSLNDMDILRSANQILENKVQELEGRIKEEENLKIRDRIAKQEHYVQEIHGWKEKFELKGLENRFLKDKNESLQKLITLMEGETEKNKQVFDFAGLCDSEKSEFKENPLAKRKPGEGVPENLEALIPYVLKGMASQGFYYTKSTIRTFLAGLHMSSITILQGISGTGKTSLPREFSKALLAGPEYQGERAAAYRICPVQSGWRDHMDLMGYFNSFENRYKETEFFQALYLANQPKYADTLFLIILDEMNLSRPEYYFTEFLSALEQEPNARKVPLPDIPQAVWPKQVRDGYLKIPQNVRFIGTANHDESTLEFAPKTYDRSNVMELPKNHPDPGKGTFEPVFDVSYTWLNEQFEEAGEKQIGKAERFGAFIKSQPVRNLFHKQDIGIGNRFEDQAGRFISVFCESGGTLAEAAEHLINSRLLRLLKDRYDLKSETLEDFRDKYQKLFSGHFGADPVEAENLFLDEIAKKESA